MPFRKKNIRLQLADIAGFSRAHSVLITVGVALALAGAFGIQKRNDRRAAELEDARTRTSNRQMSEHLEDYQRLLESAKENHEKTGIALGAIAKMSESISVLAESERITTKRANAVREGETRPAKNDWQRTKNGTAKLNRKPLKTREIDVLKADRKLFPGN